MTRWGNESSAQSTGATLWVPQPMTVPSPSELAAYLLQGGWVLEHEDESWTRYGIVAEGEQVLVELPLLSDARDYRRVVGTLLDDLARLEGREVAALLRDIKTTSFDIVRLAIEGPTTRDGRIPVEAGRRVFDGARELLLAAASSVLNPRSVLGKRKPDEAMKLLERARFGQTEIGSFVVSLELAVAPLLQPEAPDDDAPLERRTSMTEAPDDDAPLERRTSTMLATALQGALTASRQSSASGKLDPFSSRAVLGVSANLCAALAELIDASAADRLETSFSFASRRPIRSAVPRKVVFTADAAPVLREAAKQLREVAPDPDAELLGPVIKLNSTNAAEGGEIVVKTEVNGRWRSVVVPVEADDYAHAIQAHKERLFVRCFGELARDGRSLVLRHARNVEVLAESD